MNALERAVYGLLFLDKLVIVFERGELDYWEERNYPPNLSIDDFVAVLRRIDRVENLKKIIRKSENGPHGKSGEAHCFQFNCSAESSKILIRLIM